MKFAGVLRVPGLGLELPVEVDLEPADVPAPEVDTIDDAALRDRWHCSARTLKRVRDRRVLPYLQPSPRRFIYRLEDVRAYEASTHRGVHRRAGRA